MSVFEHYAIWLVIGSQHLYGQQTLQQVQQQAKQVENELNRDAQLPCPLILKPLLTCTDEITALCREANHDERCAGLVVWLHTFSPAKMWINGLHSLNKPLLQLHTQFNAPIPWDQIDMDFMNLNQTAHGGREFGFIGARMRLQHTVISGHWQDKHTQQRLKQWIRLAITRQETQTLKIVRFGDNMREVAVTEGDKVAAQMKFGFSVNSWPVSELAASVNAVSAGDISALIEEYESCYRLTPAVQQHGKYRQNLRDAAAIEIGLKRFLQQGGFHAFTTTFEDLHGLKQLPGIAVQRLMQQGYGFAAEGDWKTAALLRVMKILSDGRPGGCSFMEDYTYHFSTDNNLVLGAHMLEICPTIASDDEPPLLDVQPLAIGGKQAPARLIFSGKPGPAINISLIDLGDRFRLLVNRVNVLRPPQPLPKLPVACALWQALPDFSTASESWIFAGGAHHTVFSQALTVEDMRLFSESYDIELAIIDDHTQLPAFKNDLRWNNAYYRLFGC